MVGENSLEPKARVRLVLISGLSGSGKSTVAKCLEDLGFYCVDNLPLSLLRPFLADPCQHVPESETIAVVADVRAPGMFPSLPDLVAQIDRSRVEPTVLFLESSDEVLVRRYSETRRLHPLAPNSPVIDGIRRERELLADLRGIADLIIDTTEFTIHEVRDAVYREFKPEAQAHARLVVSLVSFGFKRGLPAGADIVFDVRHLPNPYFQEGLRALTGLDLPVTEFLGKQESFDRLVEHLRQLLEFQLPLFSDENRSYLTVGVGCTGGQHRSVAVVEQLASRLRVTGWTVRAFHRELAR